MFKISITETYAVGASCGQKYISPAMELLRRDPTVPFPILFSFKEVAETNASFVKASVLHLFNCGRHFALGTQSESNADDAPIQLNCFPAVTECSEQVVAEVEDVFRLRQLPFIEVENESTDSWHLGNLRGHLEPALIETFREVIREDGGVTAAILRQRYSGRIVGSAWNNRLEALHALRLVQRSRMGREWKYEALTKETNIWVNGSSNKKRNFIS